MRGVGQTCRRPDPSEFKKDHALDFPGRFVLRVGEVAARLSISKEQVVALIDEGKLHAINAAGAAASRKCYRIPVEALRAYLRAQTI